MQLLADAIYVGGGDLIHTLLFLVVVGIVLGIIYYLVTIAPFLPDIFKKVLGWLIILFGALILINVLLGLVGHPIVEIH
jgi:uncharacterized membrane protein YjjP (DUF1212 family)